MQAPAHSNIQSRNLIQIVQEKVENQDSYSLMAGEFLFT